MEARCPIHLPRSSLSREFHFTGYVAVVPPPRKDRHRLFFFSVTPPLRVIPYISEIRNSRQPREGERGDPFPTGGWENGEEIRDRGRVLFPFFLFFFPFFLFFTLVRVLGFHRGSVENLGTSRKFLVARRASNSSCFPSLPPLGTLKSLQRGASLGELRINAPRANDEFSSENSL